MQSPFPSAAICWIAFASSIIADDPNDWPMYNRNVQGWRFNDAEKTLSPTNVGKLEEKWKFPPRDAKFEIGVVHATPSVVDGKVYFGTASDPAFYALNEDGSLKWAYRNPVYGDSKPEAIVRPTNQMTRSLRFQTSPNGILGSALVTADAVYFGDIGGWFYCLDRETGAERWKVSAKGSKFPDSHPLNSFFSSPILADGKIVVGGGTLEQVLCHVIPFYPASSGRGFVIAFDPKNGKIVWKHDVGPRPQRFSPAMVVDGPWGARTYQYGPATSSIWSTPSFDAETRTIFFGTDVNTAPRQPTKDNPNLHTPDSCAIRAIDVRDGKLIWNTQINPGDVWDNSMRGYDPKTGQYKDQSIGDTPKIVTLPIDGASIKCVAAGCKNGGFYLLRSDDGRLIRNTPVYKGAPSDPPNPPADPRTLALPGLIGGLQSGCATDGKAFFTNGIDTIKLGNMERPDESSVPPTGGRVTSISLDLLSEHWRHERPRLPTIGGPPPKVMYTNVGDPVASGIALANGVAYFTAVASGKLIALDATSGTVLKEFTLGPVWCGPSISRGRVYVGGGNTLFNNTDAECFFPKKMTGGVHCFGLSDK